MFESHHTYEITATSLADEFIKQIHIHARKINVSPDALLRAVVGEMLGEEKLADGRALEWCVRLRLYNYHMLDEPEADSDDRLDADQPGSFIVRGLPNLIKWVIELTSNYHRAACVGLEERTLRRKLRSLRTQMSHRGDNTGTMHVEYEVSINGETRYMHARIDVCRADRVDNKFSRRLPGVYSD